MDRIGGSSSWVIGGCGGVGVAAVVVVWGGE